MGMYEPVLIKGSGIPLASQLDGESPQYYPPESKRLRLGLCRLPPMINACRRLPGECFFWAKDPSDTPHGTAPVKVARVLLAFDAHKNSMRKFFLERPRVWNLIERSELLFQSIEMAVR